MNHVSLASLALVFTLAGCSSSDSEPVSGGTPAEAPRVQIEAIEGEVAQADFCGQFRKIQCAASAGCCGRADLTSGSEEACLAATSCPLEGSAAVQSGALTYDPAGAGDFLRTLIESASFCALPSDRVRLSFLRGTRGEGEDCSPAGGDTELMRSCAPGLACALSTSKTGETKGTCAQGSEPEAQAADGQACEDGTTCQSGRCADGVCAKRLADGVTCSAGDECLSGLCTDGSAEPTCGSGACKCTPAGDRYCNAPTPEAPSNADWTHPKRLCVRADTAKNSGTDGEIILAWEYDGWYWGCTLPNGVETGEKECCTANKVYGGFSTTNKWFHLQSKSTDGLKFDKVYVETDTDTWSEGTWNHNLPKGDCDGCVFGQDCNTCWADSDDHGKCTNWLINMKARNLVCEDYIGWYP